MPKPKIVQTAQQRPGGDFLTGDSRGPFLDTGLKIGRGKARYGSHIYLSLKHLAPVLREEGWKTAEDVEDLVERLDALQAQVDELEPKAAAYEDLVEKLQEHIEPVVKTVEKVVTKGRKPTDAEIERYISANRRSLRTKLETVTGSDDHYEKVYAGHGYVSGERTPTVLPATAKSEPHKDGPNTPTEPVNKLDPDDNKPVTSEEHDEVYPDNEPSVFELQGQPVKLDDVLSGNIKEIVAFSEGHPEEFLEALAAREYELGEIKGDPHPRKGVIEGLGYEFEDDDDEDEDEEDPELDEGEGEDEEDS